MSGYTGKSESNCTNRFSDPSSENNRKCQNPIPAFPVFHCDHAGSPNRKLQYANTLSLEGQPKIHLSLSAYLTSS